MSLKSTTQKLITKLMISKGTRILFGWFFLLYGSLGLLMILITLGQNFFGVTRLPLTEELSSITRTYVAQEKPSAEIMIDDKLMASKVNLQRKVLQVAQGRSVQEAVALAEQYDAQVISTHTNTIVVEFTKDQAEIAQEELIATGVVAAAEVDYPVAISADYVDWGAERIEAPAVWETTTADNVLIAVIDTGIDSTHSDLAARYAGGYNVIDPDTVPFDDHGHGTHVAGIIAADLNYAGVTGVSPKANIYAIKALAADGTGYLSDVIEAVNIAMQQNVAVINFSLGTSYNSSLFEAKLQEAASQGIFMVAAAGNTNGGSLLYPAAYGTVVAVSAIDQNDNFASFSSLGAELAAPGVSINSTLPGGSYARWSGTSMAAPHVSATAALMMANGQENIREGLRNTAIDLGPAGRDVYYGYGLVYAKPAALGMDVLAPIITFISPEHQSEVQGEITVEINVQDESKLSAVTLFLNDEQVKAWTEPEQLQAEDYQYQWNTTTVEDGVYTWLARAVDEYDNQAEAKIQVKVNQELEPTPTVEPTPTMAPDESNGFEQGQSGDVRQDIYQEQAQERRQDYDRVPTSIPVPQERAQPKQTLPDSGSSPRTVPDVTNVNQRNPRSGPAESSAQSSVNEDTNESRELPPQAQERVPEQTPARGRVRGEHTTNWWAMFVDWLRFF